MKLLPEISEPAIRRFTRAWLLALAVLPAASAAGADLADSPPAEVRSVSDEAEPCLALRQRPSRRAKIVECLDAGTLVTVTGKRGAWSRVAAAGGVFGWADTDLLEAAAAPARAPAAEAPATEKAPVRIVVASGSPAGPATPGATARADRELDELSERARIAEERAASLETELAAARDDLSERARIAEQRAASLEAELAAAARDDRSERARIAEERAASLETELAAARDDREAREPDQSGLAARVEELTRERDELAHKLVRAEARVLYLISDLERTRSELMRLKGIPAQLVRPEPEPEPVSARPEPETEQPAAAGPDASAAPLTPAFVSIDAVVGTVRAWAQAWASQRVDDYLAFYSSSFRPPDGESREAWAERRRERILAPRSISVTLERINPIISGDRASVTFVQSYASDTFSDTVTKTLVMERVEAATWQIVEERVE